jgi:hypothetical protein
MKLILGKTVIVYQQSEGSYIKTNTNNEILRYRQMKRLK